MKLKVFKMYSIVFTFILLMIATFIFLENKNLTLMVDESSGLSAKTMHLLNQMINEKSVKLTVFSREESAVANKIKKFLAPFKNSNKSLGIEFVDPSQNPSLVQKNSITMQGEIVLSFQDDKQLKKINITELSESAIGNAILRLQNQNDEWVVFAERFGMKTIGDETDLGLSKLLIHLKKSGFNIARMPLDSSLVLPDNVRLLILPNPVESLTPQIVDYLNNLLDSGVSLLWLDDVTSNQANLELALGSFSGETLMIADEKNSNYLSTFPQHAITENFNQPIYIADAKEIDLEDSQAFIDNRNGKNIAVAKQLAKSRLIIVGDSNFMTNQYLDVVANKSMVERMIDWLLYHGDRVNIPVHINSHTQLFLTQTQLVVLSVLFLIIIPLFFLFMGFYTWRKNRA